MRGDSLRIGWLCFTKKKMILLQADTIRELLSIETISVIGLLLAICGLLIWHISNQNKKIKEKDEFIQSISEKFFILAGKMELLINQKKSD
jgi:hypothetical protein